MFGNTNQTLCPARDVEGSSHPYEDIIAYLLRKEDEHNSDAFELSDYKSVFYANLAKHVNY